MCIYKGTSDLRAPIEFKFQDEEGVGTGPVRSFISTVMSLLETGFSLQLHTGQGTLVVLEGLPNHRIPMVSPLLRQTGLFEAVGRMMAHSVLHGGPPFYHSFRGEFSLPPLNAKNTAVSRTADV